MSSDLAIARAFYDLKPDRNDPCRRGREMFARATSVAEFTKLNIAFLSGVLPETADHAGPPCEETDEIAEDLIALNRAGFITTFSQPFRPNQKPFVEGMVATARVLELRAELDR